MATISLIIPNDKVARIQEAICTRYRYTGLKPDGTSQTKAEFVKAWIIKTTLESVREYEREVAIQSAVQTIENDLGSIDIS